MRKAVCIQLKFLSQLNKNCYCAKKEPFCPEAPFKCVTTKAASKQQLCGPQHQCHPGQSLVHPGEKPLPSTNLLQSRPGSGLLAHFCLQLFSCHYFKAEL